jgi:hypothetical protein
MTGDSVSSTVTRKKQVAEFENASVATQLTNVVPAGNREPDGGEH